MRCLLTVVLFATASGTLQAQRLAPPFGRHPPDAYKASERTAPSQLFPKAADHRYEGAILGIVLIGGGAAILGRGMCESSELDKNCGWETLKFALVGSLAGGISGALIGAAFPKRQRS